MDQESFENLEIDNVRQERFELDEGRIDIEFNMKGFPYYLIVEQNAVGVFQPYEVRHKSDELCMSCKKTRCNWVKCEILCAHKRTLFDRLIQFPSIRLEWLYIDHA